jgi:hypothetical protein
MKEDGSNDGGGKRREAVLTVKQNKSTTFLTYLTILKNNKN